MDNQEQINSLKDFLMDIDCLSKLETNAFNMFDILKISRTEIRHSNVLSWILDPNGNHGFGQRILSNLNTHLAKLDLFTDEVAFKLLTMDYSDVVVYREWQNIDILIVSKSEKYVLCIENKIDTQDHGNQLDKYVQTVRNYYPDYDAVYLYLSPEGLEPQNDSNSLWQCLKYEFFILTLEREMQTAQLNYEAEYFIKSYIRTLRRETMENSEIIELCQKIYREHRVALDLIFENRPDRLQNVSEHFKAWCRKKDEEGVIIFDSNKSSKSYMRFRTKAMDNFILPCDKPSGWGTTNHYYYEIASVCTKSDDVKYYIQLGFSSFNLPEDNLKQMEKIVSHIQKKPLKDKWQWRTVHKTKTKTIHSDEQLPDSTSEDNFIFSALDKQLKEILDLEKNILSIKDQ